MAKYDKLAPGVSYVVFDGAMNSRRCPVGEMATARFSGDRILSGRN
ncbi:hypothetical protein [Rhizobium sp. Root1220]|nr:hypothetical protein [Rhizobium sp. Root1220]